MTETVWMYWENLPWMKRRPPFLDLCVQTVKRHLDGLNLEIVNFESAPVLLPQLDVAAWEALPGPVFRADYLRSRLVHTYGGIWLDIDCIGIDRLTRLFDLLDDDEFAGYGDDGSPFTAGLFVGRAGARFLTAWAAGQDQVIRNSGDLTQLSYHALGRDVTDAIAARIPFPRIPRPVVAPVSWYEWRRFLSRVESPARVLASDPVTVLLYNGAMLRYLRKVEIPELLSSDMLVSRLMRIALGESRLIDELDQWTHLHALSDIRFSGIGRRMEVRARNALRLTPY